MVKGSDWHPFRSIRTALLLLALTPLLLLPASAQQDPDALRPEAVGWARLKTPSEWWRRHSTGDPTLMQFLRDNTTLNIDPQWYVADVESLPQLAPSSQDRDQDPGSVLSPIPEAPFAETYRAMRA